MIGDSCPVEPARLGPGTLRPRLAHEKIERLLGRELLGIAACKYKLLAIMKE
jgi:hypothetical protein